MKSNEGIWSILLLCLVFDHFLVSSVMINISNYFLLEILTFQRFIPPFSLSIFVIFTLPYDIENDFI